ncbi:glycosyltransferase family 39 protein [Primorskyibacter aestuariivivens]|uniref:ArnT family glycosyltransferase n=1 Tax=Primorskyibacter aestuariivivens TaxID=1888912 RepID=UPI0022FFC47C|nr:glycosyltransferase family 39 protein [Primorskyibacter aestuariivivens]MDA7430549.1 glycosyltransferase family 39 protein [Primorskyibacter aestuariivivens]
MTPERGSDQITKRFPAVLGLDRARRLDLVLLGLVLLLAGLLRLQYAFQPIVDAFSWREASTAMIAENIPLHGWNIFYPEVSWTGPGPSYQGREFQLMTLLAALYNALFGWQDWSGRLVAVAFSLLTVLSLHRLTALIWNETHAHVVALVYALLPAAIMIDSSYLPDPVMLALITAGIWLFVRYYLGGSALVLAASALCFTLGALCKLPGIAIGLVPAWLTVLLLLRGEIRRAAASLTVMLVSLLVIIAYYAWAVYLGNTTPPYHVAGSGYIWDNGLTHFLDHGFWFEDFANIAVWWFYGMPFLALLLVGLWAYPGNIRKDENPDLPHLPLVWSVGCVIVYLLAAREISNNPWNLHIFSIPVALFGGRGLVFLMELGGARVLSPMGALRGVLAIVVLGVNATMPLLSSMKAPHSENARLLGAALNRLTEPDDLVIAISPDLGDPVAIYYSRNRGWVFPPGGGQTVWSVFAEDDQTAMAQLEDLRAQGAGWFGYATNAEDDLGRYFVDHHAGFIDWLNETETRIEATREYVIYRLAPQSDH